MMIGSVSMPSASGYWNMKNDPICHFVEVCLYGWGDQLRILPDPLTFENLRETWIEEFFAVVRMKDTSRLPFAPFFLRGLKHMLLCRTVEEFIRQI